MKLQDGRIIGPYETKRILDKIARGSLSGDEQISKYPGGDWIAISSQPEFYDLLLNVLSGAIDKKPKTDTSSRSKRSTTKQKGGESKAESAQAEMTDQDFEGSGTEDAPSVSELEMEKTRVVRSEKKEQTIRTSTKKAKFADETYEDDDEEEEEWTYVETDQLVEEGSEYDFEEYESDEIDDDFEIEAQTSTKRSDDIELIDVRKAIRKIKKKKTKLPLIVIAVVLLIGAYFLSQPVAPQRGFLSLKRIPLGKGKPMSAEQIKTATSRAVGEYLKDDLRSYRSAESQLVNLIASDPRNLNLFGILCLTQFEIWPSARQSSNDLQALEQAVQMSSAVNPTHLYAYTCKASSLMLLGKIQEASAFVEQILTQFRGSKTAAIPFYYFKALLLASNKDYQTAIGYANSASKLWPQWLRAYVLEATLHMKTGNNPAAYKILSAIYKNNQQHAATKVLLGIIEFRQYGNTERALAFLKSGLKSAEQVPRHIAADGYLVQAKISLASSDQAAALSAAKKAYKFDPGNDTAKNLVLRLGGKESLKVTALKAHELMLEGDNYVRQGDCQSAQAHYKSAFEIDKKLGIAAYKAGKCLWKVSFSTEAIQWMKKAIKADPRLIDAYIVLADFYSQRYNFIAAGQTLQGAARLAPKSHEVLRGFAQVELRRNNSKAAVGFAKQALAVYSNDVESMVILSKAYLQGRSNIQEAFAQAAKAVEIDSSHRAAQIVYARALARLQGAEFGIEHLEGLISRYPLVEEYRMALGRLYLEDDRFSSAESVFRQMVEIQDKPKEPLLELGRVLKIQGQFQEALDSFFKAAVFDPADAEPFFEAGKLLLEFKKPKEARKQFERVLVTNPKYPLVHYNIGKAELLINRPKNALKEADKEKRANPNMAAAYMLAAEAYAKRKQFNLCAQEYQRAIKLRPQGAESYVKAAACYRQAGNFDSAESMLNIASRKESGNSDIYREQGALYEAKGDYEKAVAAYQEYFILNPNAPDRTLIEGRIQRMGR
ncbi:MAG: tetratricopeptide repeat protein [Bdellovibrionales bacterium]|nr:tetratricopeptide repeat protein [Bdellovibrionales bacterium]